MILTGYIHKGVLSQTPHHMQPTELIPQYYALPYQTPDRTMPRDTKERNGQRGTRKKRKKLVKNELPSTQQSDIGVKTEPSYSLHCLRNKNRHQYSRDQTNVNNKARNKRSPFRI